MGTGLLRSSSSGPLMSRVLEGAFSLTPDIGGRFLSPEKQGMLPPELTEDQQRYIVEQFREFYQRERLADV